MGCSRSRLPVLPSPASGGGSTTQSRRKLIRRMHRTGIVPAARPVVWQELLGVADLRKRFPGLYEDLLARSAGGVEPLSGPGSDGADRPSCAADAEHTTAAGGGSVAAARPPQPGSDVDMHLRFLRVIRADVPRTHGHLPALVRVAGEVERDGGNMRVETTPGPAARSMRQQLLRILVAYATLDAPAPPGVGYCQGMSHLTSLLLLAGLSEEDAFLGLLSLMTRFGLRGLYTEKFPALPHICAAVGKLMAGCSTLRKAKAAMEGVGLDLQMVLLPWLLTMFADSQLPVSSALCIVDYILLTHDPAPLPAARFPPPSAGAAAAVPVLPAIGTDAAAGRALAQQLPAGLFTAVLALVGVLAPKLDEASNDFQGVYEALKSRTVLEAQYLARPLSPGSPASASRVAGKATDTSLPDPDAPVLVSTAGVGGVRHGPESTGEGAGAGSGESAEGAGRRGSGGPADPIPRTLTRASSLLTFVQAQTAFPRLVVDVGATPHAPLLGKHVGGMVERGDRSSLPCWCDGLLVGHSALMPRAWPRVLRQSQFAVSQRALAAALQ